MILWCQADPGCELPCRRKLRWIRGLHSQQHRADRSNTRDLDETLTAFVSPVKSRQFGVDLFDLYLQLHKLRSLGGEQFTRQGGQALIGFNTLNQWNQPSLGAALIFDAAGARKMLSITTKTTTDVDEFRGQIRPDNTEFLVTGKGPFSATVTKIDLIDLGMQSLTESHARTWHIALARSRIGVAFSATPGPAILALIALHMAAALHHHFVRRDDILLRMLPRLHHSTSFPRRAHTRPAPEGTGAPLKNKATLVSQSGSAAVKGFGRRPNAG
jgi:hypothetical protein